MKMYTEGSKLQYSYANNTQTLKTDVYTSSYNNDVAVKLKL
jgi:hypothetical protein